MSEKKQWFENENFWNNYGPIMFDANRWAEAPAVAESVCKIAGLKEAQFWTLAADLEESALNWHCSEWT